MVETTVTATIEGHNRADDIRVLDMEFAAVNDHAWVYTHGYDYMNIIPFDDGGVTEPAALTTFKCYGAPDESSTTISEVSEIPEDAGKCAFATITASGAARTMGYIEHPPKLVLIVMSGSNPADQPVRVELRKTKTHGTLAGRG